MYGARYQWIHWSARHGLDSQLGYGGKTPHPDGCTNQQVLEAAEGMFYVSPQSKTQYDNYNRVGVSGYVGIHAYIIYTHLVISLHMLNLDSSKVVWYEM